MGRPGPSQEGFPLILVPVSCRRGEDDWEYGMSVVWFEPRDGVTSLTKFFKFFSWFEVKLEPRGQPESMDGTRPGAEGYDGSG